MALLFEVIERLSSTPLLETKFGIRFVIWSFGRLDPRKHNFRIFGEVPLYFGILSYFDKSRDEQGSYVKMARTAANGARSDDKTCEYWPK